MRYYRRGADAIRLAIETKRTLTYDAPDGITRYGITPEKAATLDPSLHDRIRIDVRGQLRVNGRLV